jgi:hypothetical protein
MVSVKKPGASDIMDSGKKESCGICCQKAFIGGMERAFCRYGEFAAK